MKYTTHRQCAVNAVNLTVRMAYMFAKRSNDSTLDAIPVVLLWDSACWAKTRRTRKAARAKFIAAFALLSKQQKDLIENNMIDIASYIKRDGYIDSCPCSVTAIERAKARQNALAVFAGEQPMTYAT